MNERDLWTCQMNLCKYKREYLSFIDGHKNASFTEKHPNEIIYVMDREECVE